MIRKSLGGAVVLLCSLLSSEAVAAVQGDYDYALGCMTAISVILNYEEQKDVDEAEERAASLRKLVQAYSVVMQFEGGRAGKTLGEIESDVKAKRSSHRIFQNPLTVAEQESIYDEEFGRYKSYASTIYWK